MDLVDLLREAWDAGAHAADHDEGKCWVRRPGDPPCVRPLNIEGYLAGRGSEIGALQRLLKLGRRLERYEPRDAGPGPHARLSGPPEDWYRSFASWLRDTPSIPTLDE